MDRRCFLQSASILVASGFGRLAFAKASTDPPTFSEYPTFRPMGLFLTWQRDPTTTITVQWIGSESDGAARPVWYAKKGSDDWRLQGYASRRFPQSDRWIFRAELAGLDPDTDYVFRVGQDSGEQAFRTMPTKDTNVIQFVSGGDSGVGTHPRQSNRLAAAQAPAFVIMGGDLAYEDGKHPDIFLEFLDNYSQDLRDADGRLIPMLALIGNHEVDGSYGQPREKAPFFYSLFDGLYPEKGFATLDIGDYMSLVFLDTNHTTPVEGEQTDWLEKTLKDRTDCPNLFVFNHVPAYPSYRPFETIGDEKGTGVENRAHWVPLFERYRVDTVFEHHDHTFKRTHPLLDGRPNEKGVLYLGDGSWGKLRHPVTPEERPFLAVTDEAYHLSVHRIEGQQQFHVALSDEGRVVDVCVTAKRGGTRRG